MRKTLGIYGKGLEWLMSQSKTLRASLRLLAFLIVFLTIQGCSFTDGRGGADAPEESGAPSQTQTPPPTPKPTFDPGFVIEPPALKDDKLPDEPAETTEGAVTGPDVPKKEAVGDEYFEDAAFVGNSLVDGFRMFSGLTVCDYYASTSMTVAGVAGTYAIKLKNGAAGTIMQGLSQREYGKVYILLGINEIDYEPEYFRDLYRDMLEEMMEIQPEANFYIMGLTPVSYSKSASSASFNMDRVRAYNDALYELAGEMGCYYLDLCKALGGSDGYLPADVTTDGVHFSASHYLVWLDYIRTHYI